MSAEPLMNGSRDSSLEMTKRIPEDGSLDQDKDDHDFGITRDSFNDHGNTVDVPALTGAGRSPSRKQRLSDLFTILCAGCALISDGYANSLMTLVNVVLVSQYPKQYVSTISTRVSNALLVGEICGQISIGLTCDYLGRKVAIILTTSMIILGLALCAGASGSGNVGSSGYLTGMFWMLTVARGITGFGTGGEYPASSTSASESANAYTLKNRGTIFILVTNLPLTFGVPLASSIFLIVLSAAGMNDLTTVWRVCFGIGIIFPVTVFYWRVKMINSQLYRRGAIRNHVPYLLVVKYYWKTLLGTCGTWFLYDFVTIPNAVFSGTVIAAVVPDGDIKATAEWQLLLGALALPGVILGALLIDKIGRKRIMMIGFGGYLVFGLILGCAHDQISAILPLFVIFYGIMLSLGNFGPGNLVGIVSTESYATAVRGTCYGLSAALGKTGAAVGTQVFQPIENNLGVRWTFVIDAIIGLVGILVTWFFIRDLTGADLAVEDEEFRAYLVRNDWKGMMGDQDLKANAQDGLSTVGEDIDDKR